MAESQQNKREVKHKWGNGGGAKKSGGRAIASRMRDFSKITQNNCEKPLDPFLSEKKSHQIKSRFHHKVRFRVTTCTHVHSVLDRLRICHSLREAHTEEFDIKSFLFAFIAFIDPLKSHEWIEE
jgi:hypothetical protein